MPAVREVHTRLCRLYPECNIVHMPAELIQGSATAQTAAPGAAPQQGSREQPTTQSRQPAGSSQAGHPGLPTAADQLADSGALTIPGCPSQQDVHRADKLPTSNDCCPSSQIQDPWPPAPVQGAGPAEVDCGQFVGNAPVYGDCYSYHVDADPASLPDGLWTRHHGSYVNGEPGELCFSVRASAREVWGHVPAGCVLQPNLSEAAGAAVCAETAAECEPLSRQALAVFGAGRILCVSLLKW